MSLNLHINVIHFDVLGSVFELLMLWEYSRLCALIWLALMVFSESLNGLLDWPKAWSEVTVTNCPASWFSMAGFCAKSSERIRAWFLPLAWCRKERVWNPSSGLSPTMSVKTPAYCVDGVPAVGEAKPVVHKLKHASNTPTVRQITKKIALNTIVNPP